MKGMLTVNFSFSLSFREMCEYVDKIICSKKKNVDLFFPVLIL